MIIFIGVFLKGQAQVAPDFIVSVDQSYQNQLEQLIYNISEMFDIQYGVESDVETKAEYMIEAIEDQIPCEIVTDIMHRIYV